jgi:hypothetical protein
MSQGQGRYTQGKIERFKALFVQNVAIVNLFRSPYFHFDLNAGCGINEKAGCEGSPLAFRAAAIKAGMPHALSFCCEQDIESAKHLQNLTRDDSYTFVVNGRNQDFVEQIPDIIWQHGVDPRRAYGSVFIDPNNHRRDAIPYDGLRFLAKNCPRIDVLFNYPQLSMKRVAGAVAAGKMSESSAAAMDCFNIEDLPKIIGKRHLWLRQQPDTGNFALVRGSNTSNIKADKRTGLAPWDSELGIWYRERCRLSVDEADRRHKARTNKQLCLSGVAW